VRVATKGLLVAVGVVLLITGGRVPRGTSTAGGDNPRGVVSIVTVAQAGDPERADSAFEVEQEDGRRDDD
jgi:hypothetical protein